MVWYFIGVYVINRAFRRIKLLFSSSVENISLVLCAHSWNIFQHSKKNFVSPRGHVISSIFVLTSGILWWEIWWEICWSYQRFQYRWTRQAWTRQSVYSTYIRGPVLRWVWTQGPYYVLWQELQSKYVSLTKFSLYLFVTVYFNNVL